MSEISRSPSAEARRDGIGFYAIELPISCGCGFALARWNYIAAWNFEHDPNLGEFEKTIDSAPNWFGLIPSSFLFGAVVSLGAIFVIRRLARSRTWSERPGLWEAMILAMFYFFCCTSFYDFAMEIHDERSKATLGALLSCIRYSRFLHERELGVLFFTVLLTFSVTGTRVLPRWNARELYGFAISTLLAICPLVQTFQQS